ncbi:high-affinity choline transporter 1-like [Haemaphysalis longicornis]
MSAAGCIIYAAPAIFIGATAKTSNFTMAKYAGRFDLEPADRKNVLPLSMYHLASGWASIGGQLAIVAAVMSSVDSSMLSASSLVAHNIYYCVARPKASDNERAIVLRCAVLLLGAVATVISLATNSVFALWTQSSELCYVLLFPQFIALFFLQRYSNAYGAVSGDTKIVVRPRGA